MKRDVVNTTWLSAPEATVKRRPVKCQLTVVVNQALRVFKWISVPSSAILLLWARTPNNTSLTKCMRPIIQFPMMALLFFMHHAQDPYNVFLFTPDWTDSLGSRFVSFEWQYTIGAASQDMNAANFILKNKEPLLVYDISTSRHLCRTQWFSLFSFNLHELDINWQLYSLNLVWSLTLSIF